MYNLVKAKPSHAKQILHYLSITCYWKEFIEGNTLDKTYEEFMLEWIVLPRIDITKVLVSADNEEKIYGCLIAGTSEALGGMPDYTPYLNPKVMEVFKTWFSYPVSDSIILELYAVDRQIKNQGYGSLMLDATVSLTKMNNKNCISCFVWTCFYDSIIAATKKEFTVIDCLKFPNPVSNIGLLYMEKAITHSNLKDYFQSHEYTSTKDLLLNNE